MNPPGHSSKGYRDNNFTSTSQNYNDFLPHQSNTPSFNTNDVPPQQQRQHSNPGSAMSAHIPTNQWQQLVMQMNGMNGGQLNGQSPQPNAQQMTPPLQHQFNQMPDQLPNQMPWPNQMSASPAFSNGMSAMGFNMPFFPQQILQEAYAMSSPVEAADEPFLLTKLLESSRRGESYKDSLNSMHGKNGHSASLWKDYYLDHKGRIDAWIAMCLQKEKEKAKEANTNGIKRSASTDVERVKTLPSIKKPSPSSFKLKREPSPSNSNPRLSISAPPVKRAYNKKPKSSRPTPPVAEQTHSNKRSTINSLTAPAPVFGGRLPAPHADIKIPDPPSRSPTPPTIIVQQGRGNRYTPEDREYFIKFIGWRLKHDPSLTRNELCELIAQKANHHTAQSWASHWSNNHDVPDKILAAARGEDIPGASDSSDEEDIKLDSRPKYKDVSTSEEGSGSDEDEQEDDEEDDDDDDDDAEGDDDDDDDIIRPIRRYSESEMSERGAAFNEADLYITAKYISSLPNWHSMSAKERWEPYGKKYPQRSNKSWAEYYRRYESALLKLVKRMKKEGSSSILTQCARPTRTPLNPKRKLVVDLPASGSSNSKRARS